MTPVWFYNRSWSQESEGDGGPRWRAGNWIWTVKTCRILAAFGVPGRVVNVLPDEGVVLAHRAHLPDGLRPGPRRTLVCLVADATRHPFAQLHVVQNPADPAVARPAPLWPAAHVPHWPEADLVPRDPARGDAFATVAYFGLEDRLAPELRTDAWRTFLGRRGLAWRVVPRDGWRDYADVDAVVAVRRFDARPRHQFPASKLYNAWLAGVPAVLGVESAYRAARRSALDYLEVATVGDLAHAIDRLREFPSLRRAMIANGRERAREIDVPATARAWRDLLDGVVFPAHARWCAATPGAQRAFLRRRAIAWRVHRLGEAARRIPNVGARARGALRRALFPAWCWPEPGPDAPPSLDGADAGHGRASASRGSCR